MFRIASLVSAALIAAATPHLLVAQAAATDTTPKISFGAFVDGYYAYDFGRPPSFDRSFAGGTVFSTQPSRHNEFNVNLAFVELKLDAPHYRGRIALQTGTSVQSNYAGEPTNGTVSGSSLSRLIQEAVVGIRLTENVWADAGVFYSNAGMEAWASRDNPTYTRSLVADYSPYYSSGVKVTWNATKKLTARFDIVNGWQNISENNSGKGAGLRLDYAATASSTLSYYNLFSDEAGSRLRTFNGVGIKRTTGNLTTLGEFDVGTQAKPVGQNGQSTWYGWTAVARVQTTPIVAIVIRAEGYVDKDQVLIVTGGYRGASNPAFNGVGGSVGVDVTPYPRIAWRNELRGLHNNAAVFPDGMNTAASKNSIIAVTSLSLSF